MAKTVKEIKNNAPKTQELNLHIGATGTRFFKGFYNIKNPFEYVSNLEGSKALDTYNRMRKSDSQVKMALLALVNPIVNARWSIQPPGDPEKGDPPTAKELEATKYINSWWFDESFGWELTLRQILSLFWAGFSVFEKVYTYDGKYYRLKTLGQRLQNTIVEWEVEGDELIRVRQYIDAGTQAGQYFIPAEKLCIFTYDQEGNDYRGQSVLRAAYKHWYYKDTFYRIQGIQIERWSTGIPRIKETGETTVNEDQKQAAINAARDLRAHEEAFLYVPSGFDIDLIDSGAGKMIDAQPAIQHHDASILKAIMAQFLELGQTETGARSLGETLKDMYLMGLGYTANYISEVIRKNILKELTAWNFGEDVRAPHLVCDGIQSKEFGELATAFSNLFGSGAVTPDDKLEAHVRNALNLPPQDFETSRKQSVSNEQNDNNSPPEPEEESENDEAVPTRPENGGIPNKEKAQENKRKLVESEKIKNSPTGYGELAMDGFYRPLRESEECVSLREIAGRLDDTKERFVRATTQVRQEAVAALINQVNEAYSEKDPLKIQEIKVPEELKQKIVEKVQPLIDDLMSYGEDKVLEELKRQARKPTIKNAFPTADDKEEEERLKRQFLTAMIAQFAEKALQPLQDEARNQARTALRTGVLAANELRENLESFSQNTLRKSSRYVTQEAFNFGRDKAAKDANAGRAEYSAILDGGTCNPCADMDGKTFDVGSVEYEQNTPPLYNCEGGSQCRCIWVYLLEEN